MSKSNCEAMKEDGREISRLLESPADTGLLQIIYTRRPDAYESYMRESGEPRVFALKQEGRIVLTCAELIREVYLGGEVKRAAYVCGLKRDPKRPGAAMVPVELVRALKRPDIDFYYGAAVATNKESAEQFEKPRKHVTFDRFASYTTYVINPKVRTKAIANSYRFRKADKEDTEAVLRFLNREGRKRDLFPVIRSFNDYYNLHIEDFYLLEDEDEIKACAAVWNVSSYKQYTLIRLKGIMKLVRLLNPLLSALGYVKLPKENEPLNFPVLAFFLSKDENGDCYKILFHKIKEEIKKRYPLFIVGLPDHHVIASLMKKLPKVTFRSNLYELSFLGGRGPRPTVDAGTIFTESALL